MSEQTEGKGQGASESSRDPRVAAAKAVAGGDEGLEMVAHSAQGAELDENEETSALDYLLGAPQPTRHEIDVRYETPDGTRKLTFLVRTIDTRRIDSIEERNVDQNTGRIDRLTADCEIVAAACDGLRDANGTVVKLNDEKFLTVQQRNRETDQVESVPLASPADALDRRFRDQLGLVSGVALEIKRTAGFSPERVSRAKRLTVVGSLG